MFYLLLSATGLGGAGAFGLAGHGVDRKILDACVDNSQIALSVAEQHGEELVELRGELFRRTVSRYTGEDAEKDWREQRKLDDIQDRRLQIIESHIEREERLEQGKTSGKNAPW